MECGHNPHRVRPFTKAPPAARCPFALHTLCTSPGTRTHTFPVTPPLRSPSLRRLQSFMLESGTTVGSIETSDVAKRAMAAESLAWNCDTSPNRATFRKLFPELVALRDERVSAAAAAAPPPSQGGSASTSAAAQPGSAKAAAAAAAAASASAAAAAGAARQPPPPGVATAAAAGAPPVGWVAFAAAACALLLALYLYEGSLGGA